MLAVIEETYGRSIAEWHDIIHSFGVTRHMQIVTHVKTVHAMGHGHANALVGWTLAGEVAPPEAGSSDDS